MEAEQINVTTISGLLRETNKRFPERDGWIFRGVSDLQRHMLVPTIGRLELNGQGQKLTKGMEQQLLSRFRDQVRPHIGLDIENEIEWLVLAQHHGLPTRFLDWTYSPLVAAYFAVKSIEGEISVAQNGSVTTTPIDGGIYAVRRPAKVGSKDRKDPFSIDRILLIDPPHISERVSRQVGVLTIHPTPTNPWQPTETIKISIPNRDKLKIKFELDRLGVNEATLFPGVDAIARYLGWRLKWGRLSDRPKSKQNYNIKK
jgi:hypothetical protein